MKNYSFLALLLILLTCELSFSQATDYKIYLNKSYTSINIPVDVSTALSYRISGDGLILKAGRLLVIK